MALADAFKRRVFSYAEFRDALRSIVRDGALPRAGQLDPAFRERLMLAVTEVNGCRYCSYLHARLALSSGMDEGEVRALLGGGLESSPQEQLPGLMFAQHYAETRGRPSREALERLVEVYGTDEAGNVIAAVQSIMLGNLYGNTFDALLWRLRLRPVPERSLAEIVGVLVGGLWIVPTAWAGMLWRRLKGRRAVVDPVDAALRSATEGAAPDPEPRQAA